MCSVNLTINFFIQDARFFPIYCSHNVLLEFFLIKKSVSSLTQFTAFYYTHLFQDQLTGLIEKDHWEDVDAQEGACEAEAEVVLGAELLTVLTREGNENLRDTVGMIKCKFHCKCYSPFKILVWICCVLIFSWLCISMQLFLRELILGQFLWSAFLIWRLTGHQLPV